jgi:uncharacterized surface protein with fasciclin (FAS1) repeats
MQIRRFAHTIALAAAIAVVAVSPAAAGGGYGSAKKSSAKIGTIVDVAKSAGSFTTLVKALDAAGLASTLADPKGSYTVFAPTDDAFAALPEGTLDGLLKDKEKLRSILLYHVVSGDVRAAQVVKLSSAKTVNGKPVSIAVREGAVAVNDANVVKTDVAARNGVIHVIDKVLIP